MKKLILGLAFLTLTSCENSGAVTVDAVILKTQGIQNGVFSDSPARTYVRDEHGHCDTFYTILGKEGEIIKLRCSNGNLHLIQ